MAFVHHLRPRYAEVDVQGVVFNAHWLTYFDEASTRFFDWMGFPPAVAFVRDFDVMVVKAVVEWEGPAGFDDDVAIAVAPTRIGNASFDLTYTATVGTATVGDATANDTRACTGVITYASVVPGTHDATPIPPVLREKLEAVAAGY